MCFRVFDGYFGRTCSTAYLRVRTHPKLPAPKPATLAAYPNLASPGPLSLPCSLLNTRHLIPFVLWRCSCQLLEACIYMNSRAEQAHMPWFLIIEDISSERAWRGSVLKGLSWGLTCLHNCDVCYSPRTKKKRFSRFSTCCPQPPQHPYNRESGNRHVPNTRATWDLYILKLIAL